MKTLIVKTELCDYHHTVYNCDDFPYKESLPLAVTTAKRTWHKNKNVVPVAENFFVTFDIESTSLRTGPSTEDVEGFMYHWQCAVWKQDLEENWACNVCFGRTWQEFQKFYRTLKSEFRKIATCAFTAWVHNLPFEFSFMWRFLDDVTDVFARGERDVIRFLDEQTVQWRCSYALTNMSLKKFCENSEGVTHYKKVGDLDYHIIRTPKTAMTDEELGYCFCDVYGLGEAIIYRHTLDPFQTMPYTSTGYVRREMRRACEKDKKYRTMFEGTKPDLEQYQMMRSAFQGGDTHANRSHTGEIIDNVRSVDFTSAYPAVMLRKRFPVGMPTWLHWSEDDPPTLEEMRECFKCNCVIMTVSFFNLKTDKPCPYIHVDKCDHLLEPDDTDAWNDNGRVLKAKFVQTTITNVDFEVILREYTMSGFIVNKAFMMRSDYLPDAIRNTIIHYFDMKTTLDGVPEKYYEYCRSKEKLNAIYGMCAMLLEHSEWVFDLSEGVWRETLPDVKTAIDDYYNSRNSFLPYQWAVFVTAYVRDELHHVIDCTEVDGVYHHLYNDTDSVKYIQHPDIDARIEAYNEGVKKENAVCGVRTSAVKPNGKVKILGIAADDGTYNKFRTWGAKKYCVENNGQCKVTVSGLSKKLGSEYLQKIGGIDKFDLGLQFPCEYSGRTVSTMINKPIHDITVDGVKITTADGICIEETTYLLGISGTYFSVLELEELFATNEKYNRKILAEHKKELEKERKLTRFVTYESVS